jgi:DNA-binding transcriptional ArsR family regulator
MKKGTKTKILDYLRQRGAVGPTEIAQKFSLSPQIIHRHLKSHLAAGTIEKIGKPPKVLYRIKSPISPTPTTELPPTTTKLIEETYTYISPQGALLEGMVGFYEWWSRVNRQEDFVRLAHEYVTQVTQLKKLQTAGGYIDATARMKQALGSITLDKVMKPSSTQVGGPGRLRHHAWTTPSSSGVR